MNAATPADPLADVLPDPLPEIFFDPKPGNFLWSMGGKWLPLSEQSSRRLMKSKGLSTATEKDAVLSEIEDRLATIQTEKFVEYVGPLAGYDPGYREIYGVRALVTGGPRKLTPKKGKWDKLKLFLQNLLGGGDVDQLPIFLAWLKIAVSCYLSGRHRKGQALVIAGVKGCGKSLLQSLITEILGGVAGRPYDWMMGATTFNEDVFEHVHLSIEDEASSSDIRTRRIFGAAIKRIAANDEHRCHAKGRKAVTLRPFWRLTISVNSEPEALLVLPPLDDSLTDKIIMLLAEPDAVPVDTSSLDAYEGFRADLSDELPAFLFDLLAWEIPAEWQESRFGVRAWQHPQILDALSDLAPETRFLSLLDAELFDVLTAEEWEGTAAELDRRLRNASGGNGSEAARVLTFGNAAGVFLGRLLKRHPDRISERLLDGHRLWTLRPPAKRPANG